jgi:pseudouridine synthase
MAKLDPQNGVRGRKQTPKSPLRDAEHGERLQRVLADAGIGSRRDCEALIEAGKVRVNGQIVRTLPAWADPAVDDIIVNGRPLPAPERHLYILLNKPTRTLTTAKDEPGADRRTVLDLVNHPAKAKLFPVGRLDYDTTGLLLLTNDGELANRLTHPRYGVPKTYRALVKGQIDEEALSKLAGGVVLTDRREGKTTGASRTGPVEVEIIHTAGDKTTLDVTIREGRNRQVRRMLASLGLSVKKLERTAMGPLRLRGVARGLWRELTRTELDRLRRAAAMPAKRTGGKNP